MTEPDRSTLEAIARLEVQLKTVLDRLTDVSSNMVTKDLYTAQNQNVEFRFRTVEGQITDWRSESVAEHVRLEAESKARHQLAQSDSKVRHEETRTEINQIRARLDTSEDTLKQARNGRVQAMVVGGISLVTSIVMLLISVAIGR